MGERKNKLGIKRASVIAALIGGLYGGAGIMPAHAPAPVPVPRSLPKTMINANDHLSVLEYRQPAVAGSIRDVQTYLRAEMEAAYPELEGTLVFMPYKGSGLHDNAHEFAEQVVVQYHRSALGREIDARADVDIVQIDNSIRNQAHAIYRRELEEKDWVDNLGYHRDREILIPVDRAGRSFHFGIVALKDDCASCMQVKPDYTASQCQSSHPDTAFIERSRRLNVAFHELAHHIADMKKVKGHEYVTDEEHHVEETRADLFGTFMQIRLLGPRHAIHLQLMSDRNADSANTYKYFNPRTFRGASAWLQGTGVEIVQRLSLPDLFNLSSSLAQLHAMNATELEQFKAHKAYVDEAKQKPVVRVTAYHYALASGVLPSSIVVNGKTLPYPEIAYQYDLAKLRNTAVGGNQYLNQLVQHNPLRAPALAGNKFEEVDKSNPAQVGAINRFNQDLYGARACLIKPPQLVPL